ncbi:hypothetical protein MBM_08627 [Drepanopeziza brunnea f. sp. 'multigermtubi' MB_m1]|uniref:Uncharacterized protein n=1 Tax=Marssonina brunnea f. sp. multigermtubi (strain MB_m1) TaxID=1072389 RepID=K1XL70_MARBU|nr:uncharacterized protein MBM_08627 [Drepanopeziza brunnea f. sp. 'multigermtubi' MB_m1]EKD13184.1 hypothetical protein MBM_08627 [Drepanopeziza brunnea f. sp. 'multigermtubi' MB_m1]
MANTCPILIEAQKLAHKVSADPEGFLAYMGGLEIENRRLTQTTEDLTKRNDELRSIIDRAHENFVRGFEAQPAQSRELENRVRALETEVRQLRKERVLYEQTKDLNRILEEKNALLKDEHKELVLAKAQINDIAAGASELALSFHQISSGTLDAFNNHCAHAVSRALRNIGKVRGAMKEQMEHCQDETARANYLGLSALIAQCVEGSLLKLVLGIDQAISATQVQFKEIQGKMDGAVASLDSEISFDNSAQTVGGAKIPSIPAKADSCKSELLIKVEELFSDQDTLFDSSSSVSDSEQFHCSPTSSADEHYPPPQSRGLAERIREEAAAADLLDKEFPGFELNGL